LKLSERLADVCTELKELSRDGGMWKRRVISYFTISRLSGVRSGSGDSLLRVLALA
jgi:hypothetical protein